MKANASPETEQESVRARWDGIHALLAANVRRALNRFGIFQDRQEIEQECICIAFQRAVNSENNGSRPLSFVRQLAWESVIEWGKGNRFVGIGRGRKARVNDALRFCIFRGRMTTASRAGIATSLSDLLLDLRAFFSNRPHDECEIAEGLVAGDTQQEILARLGICRQTFQRRLYALRGHWRRYNRRGK